MTALHELVEEYRQNLENSDRDPNQAKVRVDDWRSRYGLERRQFHQVKKSLATLGAIKLFNGYVEIP